MYHKHHTEGLVLGSVGIGESNRAYRIFSRELGLIRAIARSARSPSSKLKSSLTDYSFGKFTFIKSKQGWKITDAILHQNAYFSLQKNSFLILAKSFSLLQKLMPEDEPNIELFDSLKAEINILTLNDFTQEQLKNLECIVVLKILSSLGYLDKQGQWQKFLGEENTKSDTLDQFSSLRLKAVKTINHSLQESQLVYKSSPDRV